MVNMQFWRRFDFIGWNETVAEKLVPYSDDALAHTVPKNNSVVGFDWVGSKRI